MKWYTWYGLRDIGTVNTGTCAVFGCYTEDRLNYFRIGNYYLQNETIHVPWCFLLIEARNPLTPKRLTSLS